VRPRRARPSLDRDGIVDAALRLVATPGVDSLSFRKLGVELEADHTAIYRHFEDRDALMRAIIDRLLGDVVHSVPAELPWDERLRRSAAQTLRSACRYPAVGVEFAQHTSGGPGERASIEMELGAWREAGLTDAEVVRFYSVYSAFVLSSAASVAFHTLTSTHVGLADDPSWLGDLADVQASDFPLVAELREPLVALSVDETYANGIELILDAARTLLASRSGQVHRQQRRRR
jgi:AcrR family transcriptional regulator